MDSFRFCTCAHVLGAHKDGKACEECDCTCFVLMQEKAPVAQPLSALEDAEVGDLAEDIFLRSIPMFMPGQEAAAESAAEVEKVIAFSFAAAEAFTRARMAREGKRRR